MKPDGFNKLLEKITCERTGICNQVLFNGGPGYDYVTQFTRSGYLSVDLSLRSADIESHVRELTYAMDDRFLLKFLADNLAPSCVEYPQKDFQKFALQCAEEQNPHMRFIMSFDAVETVKYEGQRQEGQNPSLLLLKTGAVVVTDKYYEPELRSINMGTIISVEVNAGTFHVEDRDFNFEDGKARWERITRFSIDLSKFKIAKWNRDLDPPSASFWNPPQNPISIRKAKGDAS